MTVVARAVINQHRRVDRVPPPAGHEVLRFHQHLAGYGPTPLHQVDAPDIGVVQVKDEAGRCGLPAFKILGASWAVARVLAVHPATTTLIAASAGNHGRAVARAAGQRGVDCQVYLPRTVNRARADLIASEGAQVRRVDGDYDAAVDVAEQAAQGRDAALVADTGAGASASWVIDGYTTLFREAFAQAADPFDVIIVPVGVGALAAAAVRSATHQRSPAMVVGVEPNAAACVAASLAVGERVSVPTPGTTMTGLDCATPSAAAWPTLRDGLAGIVTVSDAETHRAMRGLASVGIVAGDCGAAALAALQALRQDDACAAVRATLRLDHSTRVLCVNTEGATDPAAYQRIVGAP